MSPGDANERKPRAATVATPRNRKAEHFKRAQAKRPTRAQQQLFLDLIRDGYPRNVAARKVNPDLTGSRFRAMCREGSFTYDERFAEAYAEAVEIGERGLIDQLDALALDRLGNVELCSDRALHNERIFRDPEYRAAHRQGAQVSVTTEMEVTHVHIEGKADELRRHLAEVVDIDVARVASRARPALPA